MSRIIKTFRALKNNPKKSLLFTGVLAFGADYAKEKYEENIMMRRYCEEALCFGEVIQTLGTKERHVTVLLNPASKNGKGKVLYEKYCAPLLHLAGIKVALVRTEHEGQALQLMGVMDNTSAVIVAGGDGTLSEVLTGLLRRVDFRAASCRFPVGILPIGETNSATAAIWGFTGSPKPRDLADATMAIINNIKRPLDVMEITPIQEELSDEAPKPVYAASSLEWGAFRDAAMKKDVYWYWAFLKKYMVYVFSSYKDITWDCSSELHYLEPCAGCSKCFVKESTLNDEDTSAKLPPRWWHAYIPKIRNVDTKNDKEPQIDYSTVINDACGVPHIASVGNVSELSIVTCNTPSSTHIPGHTLAIRKGTIDLGTWDFIREAWSREWSGGRHFSSELLVGEVTLSPTGNIKTKEGVIRELSIDNENFEVRPMRIKIKPRAVNVFCPVSPPQHDCN